MRKEELEKCISDLSPELQEKARACKDNKELYELIAENDVELSDNALETVAGGCSASSDDFDQGDPISDWRCPLCGCQLYYWDEVYDALLGAYTRAYCDNTSCSSYHNGLWRWKDGGLKKC